MRGVVSGLYRYRFFLLLGLLGLMGAAALMEVEPVARLIPLPAGATTAIVLVFLSGLGVTTLLTWIGPGLLPRHPVRTVLPPVRGEWSAMNSPASKVPSHGVRLYGQAHAIDLVAEGPAARPAFGTGPGLRRPQDYPGFGQGVQAMGGGVVITAIDRRRDHRARSRWPAVMYMILEGTVRELSGLSFLLGNHVTIDHGDGTYSLVAHLQRGSLTVTAGDWIRAGDHLGACGNSGNSSEPHVHAQLMDRPTPRTAHGLPLRFAGITDSAGGPMGLPANGETLHTSVAVGG